MNIEKSIIRFVELKGDVCIASATCCVVAGEIFRHDAKQRRTDMIRKDGELTQLRIGVEDLAGAGDRDEELAAAAGMCPVAAIWLYDGEGRRLLPDELTPME